jgi:hypothetical protein
VNKDLIEKGNQRAALGQVVAAAGGQMVQTEAGLVVPASAVEDTRAKRTWDWQMWKNLRRMIRFFAQEEITMVLGCAKCQAILRPIPSPEGGYNLECKCKIRQIRPNS